MMRNTLGMIAACLCLMLAGLAMPVSAQTDEWVAPTWGDANFDENFPIAYVSTSRGWIYVQFAAEALQWKTTIMVASPLRNVNLVSVLRHADGSTHVLNSADVSTGVLQDPHESGGLITTFFLDQTFIDKAKAADSWTVQVGLDRYVFPMKGSRLALEHVETVGYESNHVFVQEQSDMEQARTGCGMQASHPQDTKSEFHGVEWDFINLEGAVEQCEGARQMLPGDAQVAYWLGRVYDKAGDSRTVETLRFAADHGYGMAYNHLGILLRDGDYVDQNIPAAEDMFRQGAALGEYVSQYNLARLLVNHGETSDHAEALENLELAAMADYVNAQLLAARWYRNGTATPPDPRSAIDFFQMALENGSGEASYELAEIYRDGEGVSPDPTAYLKYLKLAADLGHDEARKELGYD